MGGALGKGAGGARVAIPMARMIVSKVSAGIDTLLAVTGGKNACIQGLHGDYIVIF